MDFITFIAFMWKLESVQIGIHPNKIQAKNLSVMLENAKKSSENLVEKKSHRML